jgi:hypothetical protein
MTNIVTLHGDWSSVEAKRLKTAFDKAEANDHKLPEYITTMSGMSGKMYRALINNLIETTPDARYLEIGSWKGSTACSAMFGNTCKTVCVDNWSEFFMGSHAKEDFHKNTDQTVTDKIDFTFLEQDFRTVDYSALGKFNVYLFDGPHDEQDQYDGVMIAQGVLDDTYVIIVDDYNWEKVRNGTMRALTDLGHTIVAHIDVRTNSPVDCERSDWHNGYFIAVVKKN